MRYVATFLLSLALLIQVPFHSASAATQGASAVLDVDGNGKNEPLSDAILILRYLFDFRGAALTDKALGTGATRTTAAQIETYLSSQLTVLDIDGNGVTEPLSDGILILRYLFDFRGSALINNAIESNATRKTAAEVETYIEGLFDDAVPPTVVTRVPANGAIITDIAQPLSYTATDAKSGIKASSLKVKINGNDRTQLASYSNGTITITPDVANYWNSGILSIEIEIADNSGNVAKVTFSVTVQPGTAALPIARPSSGNAPLTVQLIPFNTTGSAIISYEWDFDNDGTFDVRETVGRNQTRIFSTPGTHTVTLKITDAKGKEITGTVDILVGNKPPVVSATATPSNGSAPLLVRFFATAQDFEGVALYEWDFEGDGTYDVSSASAIQATHTYSAQGKFQPVLRVKDTLGVATTYAFPDIEVQINPVNYPLVSLSASPKSGDAPLTVNFNANASATGSRTLTRWEWDFEGDGTYDETTASNTTSHKYTVAGSYYVRVRVTDSDNQSSEDVIRIDVEASVTLSLSTDTIDTGADEKVTIHTVLGADSTVSIIIEDRYGNPVKTLFSKGNRNAGAYDDEWDGNGDNGKPVSEGEYRAILLYEIAGVEQRFDLSTTTGGATSTPRQPNRIPRSFEPFANNPLVISFTLRQASEVTAFMGNFSAGAAEERFITFMQRKPMGKGTHHIVWNGEDSEGKLIHLPEGETFIPGAFVYTFPDNGIYVRSGSHISNVLISPTLLVPSSINHPVTKLTFDLSNDADIRLTIYEAETGQLLLNKTITGKSIGSNEIIWDGKNSQGIFVEPGRYRLGLTAIDSNGYQSVTQYALQQVYY